MSMNTQAVVVEQRGGRPMMSGFHGCWSMGAFAGAGLGVIGVAAGLSLSLQLVLLGVPVLVVVESLTAKMLPDTHVNRRKAYRWPFVASPAVAAFARPGCHCVRVDALRRCLCRLGLGLPTGTPAVQLDRRRPRLHRLCPGNGEHPVVGQPPPRPVPGAAVAPGPGGNRDHRVHRRTPQPSSGYRHRGLRVPRNRSGLDRSHRVQRSWPTARHQPGHGDRRRLGLRMDGVRVRTTPDRRACLGNIACRPRWACCPCSRPASPCPLGSRCAFHTNPSGVAQSAHQTGAARGDVARGSCCTPRDMTTQRR